MLPEKHPVIEDLPALALGSLEPEERRRVESHLAACPACRAEFHAYQDALAALTTLVPQVEPPAHLKRRLLAQAAQGTRQATSGPARTALAEWFARLFSGPGALLRVAGLAAILVLLFSNLILWQRVDDLSRMQRHGYASVLLSPTQVDPNANGMVVYTADGRFGFLVVNDLHALPADQQYQLWLIQGDERTSGGVFSVDPEGYFVMEIEAPQQLTGYDAFGITVEPAGGSPGPTGDRVLFGSF